jgi:hypothetical protein
MPALCVDVWFDFALWWFAAITGVVTRAVAGTMTANAAIRRLNEVITSVCSRCTAEGKKLIVGANFAP